MRNALVLGFLSAAAIASGAAAHHSFAMFDSDNIIDIKGTVKELRWTNPHVFLEVYATSAAKPTTQVWSIELTSPSNLTRRGWTKRTLKPGDNVVVTIAPLRDGKPGGGLRQVVNTATGEKMGNGGLRDQTSPVE
jgi:hypothetical protein